MILIELMTIDSPEEGVKVVICLLADDDGAIFRLSFDRF